MWVPNGNCVCTAPSSAAVPALAFRNPRRLMPLLRPLLVIVSVVLFWFETLLLMSGTRFLTRPTKKPQPEVGSFSLPRSAALLCGPSLDLTPKLGSGVVWPHSIQVSCQSGSFPD